MDVFVERAAVLLTITKPLVYLLPPELRPDALALLADTSGILFGTVSPHAVTKGPEKLQRRIVGQNAPAVIYTRILGACVSVTTSAVNGRDAEDWPQIQTWFLMVLEGRLPAYVVAAALAVRDLEPGDLATPRAMVESYVAESPVLLPPDIDLICEIHAGFVDAGTVLGMSPRPPSVPPT